MGCNRRINVTGSGPLKNVSVYTCCVYMYTCVHVCVCTCMSKPEDNLRCHPFLYLSTLLLEANSLAGTQGPPILLDGRGLPGIPLTLPPRRWCYKHMPPSRPAFDMNSGNQPWPCTKHKALQPMPWGYQETGRLALLTFLTALVAEKALG